MDALLIRISPLGEPDSLISVPGTGFPIQPCSRGEFPSKQPSRALTSLPPAATAMTPPNSVAPYMFLPAAPATPAHQSLNDGSNGALVDVKPPKPRKPTAYCSSASPSPCRLESITSLICRSNVGVKTMRVGRHRTAASRTSAALASKSRTCRVLPASTEFTRLDVPAIQCGER